MYLALFQESETHARQHQQYLLKRTCLLQVSECETNIGTLEGRLEKKEEHLLDALSKLEV